MASKCENRLTVFCVNMCTQLNVVSFLQWNKLKSRNLIILVINTGNRKLQYISINSNVRMDSHKLNENYSQYTIMKVWDEFNWILFADTHDF